MNATEKTLNEYTKNQHDAIITDDNLRIIACAGSGKTKTLVGKIKYLLEKDTTLDIRPENIIAFTYTEKAANELKSRIVNQLNSKNGVADMFVGTIHGWCLKALQDYKFEKYQSYSVLSDVKLKLFVDKYYYINGMSDIKKIETSKPMQRFKETKIFLNIMDLIREQDLKSITPEYILSSLQKYEKSLTDKKYFDFTMLLTKTLEALNEENELTKKIKTKIKYLIVDEYQDINSIQNKLIQKICDLSNCKIIAVGDDDQNIYKWRGSNNIYLRDFFKKDAVDIKLDINFRSSEGIVKLAATLIENNKHRLDKDMKSDNNQQFNKNKDIVFNHYNSVDEENEAIANYIENEILGIPFMDEGIKKGNKTDERGLTYSDICILVREWKRAASLTHVLEQRKIIYVTGGVTELFEQNEVIASLGIFEYLNSLMTISSKHIANVSKIINNEFQQNIFQILIDTKKRQHGEKIKIAKNENNTKEFILRKIKKALIDILNQEEGHHLKNLDQNLLEKWSIFNIDQNQLRKAINELINKLPLNGMFHKCIGNNERNEYLNFDWEYNLQSIFQDFLETANITEEQFISDNDDCDKAISRAEVVFFNLGKFSQVINDYEEVNFTTNLPTDYLTYFLNFIEYVAKDYYEEGWINNNYRTVNAVKIMTIHQSKGLEFPVIIIPGLNENYLPGHDKGGTSAKHYLPIEFEPILQSFKIDADKEDERRLFYVAITRSKKFLFMSQAPVNKQVKKLSRFITEMEPANILVENHTKIFDDKTKIPQVNRMSEQNIQLDFTTLSDYFYCPYRFKLASLYGFSTPLNRRMGYGKSFHSALMEYHIRRANGELFNEEKLNDIVERQMYFPYQSELLASDLKEKLTNNLKSYHKSTENDLKIEYIEQDIQYKINDNILIIGKVDLIKEQKPYGEPETIIIDFKTKVPKNAKDKEISEELTKKQLNLYAIGYKELTGNDATHIQIFNLDYDNKQREVYLPEVINKNHLQKLIIEIKDAVTSIKKFNFSKDKEDSKCKLCNYSKLCTTDY